MTTYKFVQGIDYGPRLGTRGISLHMSEGGDGLVSYLARRSGESDAAWRQRVNGVSCNAAILSTGTIVKMLGDDRASGNLNPNDRAGEYGYYGGSHLRAVLGDGWTNPNAWTLSIELAGRRADGPTDAQVLATIKLCNEWKAQFSDIRGATGHHDQSPKECPGTTPNMLAIFEGLGGHGLWTQEAPMRPFPVGIDPQLVAIKTGAQLYLLDLAPSIKVSTVNGAMSPYTYRTGDVSYRVVEITTGGVKQLLLARAADCTLSPVTADCTAQVAAEHERTRQQAIAAVEAIA